MATLLFTPDQLHRRCHRLGADFIASLRARGEIIDGTLHIDQVIFNRLFVTRLAELPPDSASRPPEITEPTLTELTANFASAMTRWASAGFQTVTKEQYDARAAICSSCEFWDATARLGLGKCKACGCTKFKRWLATERCPKQKWPSLAATARPSASR